MSVKEDLDKTLAIVRVLIAEQHKIEQALFIATDTLKTIVCNTEPDAIKHRDYNHLSSDIYDYAHSTLERMNRILRRNTET